MIVKVGGEKMGIDFREGVWHMQTVIPINIRIIGGVHQPVRIPTTSKHLLRQEE
jgi:hypothetical protein